MKKIFKNSKSVIEVSDARVVPVMRVGKVDWAKIDIQKLDRKIRKLLTMHGIYHAKVDMNRLQRKRELHGRGLIAVGVCVQMQIKKNACQNIDRAVRVFSITALDMSKPSEWIW